MEEIHHSGRVVQLEQDKIRVEIISQSACHNCAARQACGMAECQSKIIDIPANHQEFHIGEDVHVTIKANQGIKAVWLVYLLPLFLVMACLCAALAWGFSEQISGISSIIILIPYYFGLFLCQKKLQKQFLFTVSKK